MKTMVIGGDGLTGYAITAQLRWQLKTDDELIVTSRRPGRANSSGVLYLDLASPPMEVPKNVDLVFLCAGINGFRECATSLSWRTNVDGVLDVAEKLSRESSLFPVFFFVYISSLAVEWSSDPYGRQKWAVEQGLRTLVSNRAIIRPDKVTKSNVNDFAAYVVDIGLNRKAGLHHWVGGCNA